MNNLEDFEKNIGYEFSSKDLLKTALSHTSYANEKNTNSNERLEFLGDSILEFVTSEYLYENYSHLSEGEMSKLRATTVCEDSLVVVANRLEFSKYILLGRSESPFKKVKKAILADSVEAVIAAMYLDSGIESVKSFIINNLKNTIEMNSHHVGEKDYKTVLQEKLQENGEISIKYAIIRESGPDHNKTFEAALEVNGEIVATGTGQSKKKAEMEAAKNALEKYN